MNYVSEGPGADVSRSVRRAIDESLRSFANLFDWSYYKQLGRIVTSASYNTGTIVYDDTGGTYERMVTLTTGTWPSWAAKGWLIIGTTPYKVDERKSDSVITLTSDTNPGADVASTTYSLLRNHYSLPADFKSGGQFILVGKTTPLVYVAPQDWTNVAARLPTNAGQPWWYTFLGSEDTKGQRDFYTYPATDAAYNIDFMYFRRPRSISTFEYKTGTVTCTANSDTLTGSGTAWTEAMEGAIIRLSPSSGTLPSGIEGENPAAYEATIKEVDTNAQTIRVQLGDEPTQSLSGVKHMISDPIDVEEGVMMNAFTRLCEWQLAKIRRLSVQEQARATFLEEFAFAKDADAISRHERIAGGAVMSKIPLRNMPLSSTP